MNPLQDEEGKEVSDSKIRHAGEVTGQGKRAGHSCGRYWPLQGCGRLGTEAFFDRGSAGRRSAAVKATKGCHVSAEESAVRENDTDRCEWGPYCPGTKGRLAVGA